MFRDSRRPRVLVTAPIPEEGIHVLEGHCDMETLPHSPSKEELVERIRDKDGMLSLLSDPVDREVMSSAPRLKVIANYAVGVDNIDVAFAKENGIVVTNTPGVLTEATADLAFALLLAAARRIPEGDSHVREGRFEGWAPKLMLGVDMHSKVMGIMGMGRIGSAVARRAKGFGMRIVYHNRTRSPNEEELGATLVSKEELLRDSDFVVMVLPGNKETYHLIGEEELMMMRPTAVLVNVGRGTTLDEAALVRALREGGIFAAGLDVYEREPELEEGLASLGNVVLAPHMGSATFETRGRMARMAAEDIMSVLKGDRPKNPVHGGH